jgi:phosphopantothenoylcysteine decarboxylase / phosphopantothenate---cysteine ligase
MAEAVLTAVGDADALLMAAAVADFRPADPAGQKIKKTEGDAGERVIRLAPNPDILTAVKEQKAQTGFPRLTVGFAAETQNALAYGQAKLQRKGLDFIAINDVSATDAGFAVNTNRVTLLGADGSVVELPLLSKTAVAEEIVGRLVRALVERPTTKDE